MRWLNDIGPHVVSARAVAETRLRCRIHEDAARAGTKLVAAALAASVVLLLVLIGWHLGA